MDDIIRDMEKRMAIKIRNGTPNGNYHNILFRAESWRKEHGNQEGRYCFRFRCNGKSNEL